MKTKTPLSHQRDKGVNLCGTTLLAGKAQRSGHSGMPGNGGGPEGPTACSALCSKGIFPVSSRPPCTKRRLSVRLGGGYSAFSAHSCDILSYLIRFPAACQEFYCQFCTPGAYWLWQRGRAGHGGMAGCSLGNGIPPPLRGTPFDKGGFRAGLGPAPTKIQEAVRRTPWGPVPDRPAQGRNVVQDGRVRTPAPTKIQEAVR